MAFDNGVLIVRNTRTGNPDPASGRCNGRAGLAPMVGRSAAPLGKHHPDAYTARRERKAAGKPEPVSRGAALMTKVLRAWHDSEKGDTAEEREANRLAARGLRNEKREAAKAGAGNPTVTPTPERGNIKLRRRLIAGAGPHGRAVRKALHGLKLSAPSMDLKVAAHAAVMKAQAEMQVGWA